MKSVMFSPSRGLSVQASKIITYGQVSLFGCIFEDVFSSSFAEWAAATCEFGSPILF